MGRKIGDLGGGEFTLQIEKKAESAEALKAYIYLIMDAQLNIQNGAFHSVVYYSKMLRMLEPHTVLFVAPTGVRKTHLALDLLEKEYKNYFDFIIIICTTLKHNETYRQQK